jgi:hypothetical protein
MMLEGLINVSRVKPQIKSVIFIYTRNFIIIFFLNNVSIIQHNTKKYKYK